jgi:hypothetical protein
VVKLQVECGMAVNYMAPVPVHLGGGGGSCSYVYVGA